MQADCGSQSVVLGPVALASHGSWLEMQNLGSQPRPSESETLEGEVQQSTF